MRFSWFVQDCPRKCWEKILNTPRPLPSVSCPINLLQLPTHPTHMFYETGEHREIHKTITQSRCRLVRICSSARHGCPLVPGCISSRPTCSSSCSSSSTYSRPSSSRDSRVVFCAGARTTRTCENKACQC